MYTDGNGPVFCSSEGFDEDLLSRFAFAFDRVLGGICERARMGSIAYVSEEDVILQERINDTSVDYPYQDIVRAFRDTVRARPASLSAVSGPVSMTYGETDAATDSIAAELLSRGVSAGDRVMVLVPRSVWYVVCAIGVLKAGAAYVPADTSHPDDRIRYMLADSGAKAVIVTPETAQRAASIIHGTGLSGRDIVDCTSVPDHVFRPVEVSPEDTSVVLYTSGTTGHPKGTAITHRGLANYGQWTVRVTDAGPDDAFALY